MDLPTCWPEPEFQHIIVESSGFQRVNSGITFEPLFDEVGLWVHPQSLNWYFVRFSKVGEVSFVACIEAAGENFQETNFAPGPTPRD